MQLIDFDKKVQIPKDLIEVRMNPSELAKFASGSAAEGILVGFEFELCVIGVVSPPKLEPASDEKISSINDVRDFFMRPPNTWLKWNRFFNLIWDRYSSWRQPQVEQFRDNYPLELFETALKKMYLARLHIVHFDDPSLEPLLKDFKISDIPAKEMKEMVKFTWDHIEDDRDKREWSFRNYLIAQKIETARDLYNKIGQEEGLEWPNNSLSEEELIAAGTISTAEQFTENTGIDTRPSTIYHSASRDKSFSQGQWIVEPDASIEPHSKDDLGLEFITPPLPLDRVKPVLKMMIEWGQNNGYTNKSTGLHINISVPGLSRSKIDFVKLAIFLGDEYLLKLFQREHNMYCQSSITKIKEKLEHLSTEDLIETIDNIKRGAMETASAIIHHSYTNKYSSININDQYIEFRGAGGDYLNSGLEKITNAMIRMAMVLKISVDPTAHQKEYLKKLYKLISSQRNQGDGLDSFSKLINQYLYGDPEERNLAKYELRNRNKRRQQLKDPNLKEWKLIDGHDTILYTFFAKNYSHAASQVRYIRPKINHWGPLWIRPIDHRASDPYEHGQVNESHDRGYTKDIDHTTDLMDALRDFFPLVMQELKLDHLPKITFRKDVHGEHAPTFGKFVNDQRIIFVDIENRHPNDICRTLAHELTHYSQSLSGELHNRSGETGSEQENQANAAAGIIMRNFNKKYPQYLDMQPVVLP